MNNLEAATATEAAGIVSARWNSSISYFVFSFRFHFLAFVSLIP